MRLLESDVVPDWLIRYNIRQLLKDRLVEDKSGSTDLRRFVNVYINDEDVRFIGGLDAELSDGDQVVVLPAVAGG